MAQDQDSRPLGEGTPDHEPAALLRETAPGPGDHGAPLAEAPVSVGGNLKHYEIIRKLGQGGMGAVFLARDTKLGRLCAVKVLLERRGRGTRAERFLAEAKATA